MKKLIKTLALVLAAVSVFCLVGCSKPSESEVLDAYKALYPTAYEIMQIAYGKGLPYDGEYDLENIRGSKYVKVSESSPYKTRAELEAAVLSVYTQDFYDDVLKNLLFGGYEANEDGLFGVSPRYKENGGVLYIDIKYEQFANVTARDVDRAVADEIKSKSAVIKVPYTVGGVERIRESIIVLTENGWRLDAMV
jgi:hypothetical protein